MTPPVGPEIFTIGPITLRWYGLLIMAGVLAGGYVASRYVQKRGHDPNTIWDLMLWVMIPALLGARLYYVFIQSPRGPDGFDRFMANPGLILQIWTGGLHIFGEFVFGFAALIAFVRWQKLPLLVYLDAVGLALPLAQAIGRQANFINQELYGPPTTLPWGLLIDGNHRVPPYTDLVQYPEGTLFHPLFLYESVWNFIGFGVLFWISRRYASMLKAGDLFLMYLIWYPFGRFFIEFLRTDSWFFLNTPFNTVHIMCFIAFTSAAVILFRRHRGSSADSSKSGGGSSSDSDTDSEKGRNSGTSQPEPSV
ncbi:MAG: prolipoprotein diacylglyceryl transferase [Chloroflexota bacterium]